MKPKTRAFLTRLNLVLMSPAIAAGATVTGCSSVQSVDDYAREHNIFGERVCNVLVEDVMSEDILKRGCPTVATQPLPGDIPDGEEKKSTEEQEPAL